MVINSNVVGTALPPVLSISGRIVQIQDSRSQEQPSLRVGCEEAPCPAEYSGSKAVVIKNNLALILGWEAGIF